MRQEERSLVVERIRRMEHCYHALWQVVMCAPDADGLNAAHKEMLQVLVQYYENGQWLEDYHRDECGELPADLRRGVLSEDGLYNLLSELDRRHFVWAADPEEGTGAAVEQEERREKTKNDEKMEK